ncbi:MAG: hypothetical protein IKJ19_07410 [Clostridia bacterium]|nr:hypothetical protein [Clostridia bacterium]
MKELFAVDITNGSSESEKFVVRKLSEQLAQKQKNFTEKVSEYENRVKEPDFLVIIRYLSLMIGLFLLVIFFASLAKQSDLSVAFNNGLVIFIFGVAFTLAGTVLLIIKKIREKKVVNDQEYLDTIKNGESIYDECVKNLQIPEKASECDIFFSVYENKKGELKPAVKAFNYVNTSVHLFSSGEYLMLGDLSTVYGIKKSDFKGYEIIKKAVTFNNWNKNIPISDKQMKPYGVQITAVGLFSVKNCVKVHFNTDGVDYFIIVPPYDSENFLKTAGIKKCIK